ncbi:hypothetical protein DFH07DRAFT_751781, partial [Mycena maculata]
ACASCGAAYETRAHYLLECPVWEPLRQPLHAASKKSGFFGPLHVSQLLTDPHVLWTTAKFVEETGRFS